MFMLASVCLLSPLSLYCCYHDYSAGTTNVSVGKFVGAICKLLGDANSQVSCCCHGNDMQFLLPW